MSDHFTVGPISGNNNAVGRGNSISIGTPAPAAKDDSGGQRDGSPRQALYAFADIANYSHLNARLQKISQDDLAELLDASVTEAGARLDLVEAQDQGDARLLTFPANSDAGKILAVMPRYLNDGLIARNEDMAPHARMRVRLAFAMGAAIPAGTGLAGDAPVTAVRLANSAVFRYVLNEATRAQCGVMIDSYLHDQFVRLRFRPDISPDDYAPVLVTNPEKGFEAQAWLRLFGYSGQQLVEEWLH